jgi:hypothetical protein
MKPETGGAHIRANLATPRLAAVLLVLLASLPRAPQGFLGLLRIPVATLARPWAGRDAMALDRRGCPPAPIFPWTSVGHGFWARF